MRMMRAAARGICIPVFSSMRFGLAGRTGFGDFSRVELKQLRHFVAVAESGGISAAARKLGLTQPALSRQIKALEDDLGVTLLDRGARSFALTPAADALVADARKLLDFCAAMTSRVRAAAAGLPLRIGYSPSLAGVFLPFAIESFTQLHTGLRVSLHDASSLEMQQALLEGRLDLMVTVPCTAADVIHWTTLRECGWRLAMSARHRLAAAVEANLGCAIIAESSSLVRDGSERLVSLPMKTNNAMVGNSPINASLPRTSPSSATLVTVLETGSSS